MQKLISIKNLTPHPVNIVGESGAIVLTIQPEATPARLVARTEPVKVPHPCNFCTDYLFKDDGISPCEGCGYHRLTLTDTVRVKRTVYVEPTGLPEPEAGTWFIVSQIVFNALPGRDDLCVPAEVVRDADGNIIGCRSFGVR